MTRAELREKYGQVAEAMNQVTKAFGDMVALGGKEPTSRVGMLFYEGNRRFEEGMHRVSDCAQFMDATMTEEGQEELVRAKEKDGGLIIIDPARNK